MSKPYVVFHSNRLNPLLLFLIENVIFELVIVWKKIDFIFFFRLTLLCVFYQVKSHFVVMNVV